LVDAPSPGGRGVDACCLTASSDESQEVRYFCSRNENLHLEKQTLLPPASLSQILTMADDAKIQLGDQLIARIDDPDEYRELLRKPRNELTYAPLLLRCL